MDYTAIEARNGCEKHSPIPESYEKNSMGNKKTI